MKRFLILFSLIAFVTVSCAGPDKIRWTKPTFKNEFEKDRWECIQSIDSYYDSDALGKAMKECLAKKGYKYQEDKVWRWKKSGFRQDEFENDRKECIDSIDKNLDSEAFGKALEECLEKKDYEFKKAEEPPSGNKVTAKDIGLIALVIVLSPLILAYGAWLIGHPL